MFFSLTQLRAGEPLFRPFRLSLRDARFLIPGAAFGLLAAHLALSLLLPAQEWITPTAWICFYALALFAAELAARQAPPRVRWRWRMFSINFVLAICSFATILYAEYPGRDNPSAAPVSAWLTDLFRVWRSLPLLLVACKPEERQLSLNRLLDACQVVLLAVILFVLFYPPFLSGAGTGPPNPSLVNSYVYTLTTLLAVLAILAAFTSRTSDSRHFHRILALYLCIGFPINLWTNHELINTLKVPPSSPLFVPSDLCLLALILAIFWRDNGAAPRPPGRRLLFLRLGTPAFLPIVVLLASMLLGIAADHPRLALAAGVTSLTLFGIRSAYGQYQLLSVQWTLESDNQRLETLSTHDALTGLYNRRWFTGAFPAEWRRAQRLNLPFSLLLLDVDYFKLYNDSQGHIAGDACLQAVSRIIASQLSRPADALVRYGGEEFIVMLPGAGQEGANAIAERIMQSVRAAELPHPSSPANQVTLSIGGISFASAPAGVACDDLLLQADSALYEAKERGRNRLCLVPG